MAITNFPHYKLRTHFLQNFKLKISFSPLLMKRMFSNFHNIIIYVYPNKTHFYFSPQIKGQGQGRRNALNTHLLMSPSLFKIQTRDKR